MLQKAASVAASILPAAVQTALSESEHVERIVAAFGLPSDSPVPVVLAATLLTILPATLLLATLGRAIGGRRRASSTPKVILVTGASSGLGKLLVDALRVAFPDAVVYGTSRKGWKPPSSSLGQGGAGGAGIEPGTAPLGTTRVEDKGTERQPLLALDVADESSVAACVDAIVARHGQLDVLINNAGTVIATWAKATTAEDAEAQMATNFFGAVRMVRRCIPHMTGECRRVINVGSIGGRIGLPYQSMYSASKAAVMVWTDALRMETWGDGVKVTLVEPGDLKPGMLNAGKADGFDDNQVAKGAFDIMRKEEADGTDPIQVVRTVVRSLRLDVPSARYLVGPDAWLVEMLSRFCPHPLKEYFLASHYRIPPRHNAWVRV